MECEGVAAAGLDVVVVVGWKEDMLGWGVQSLLLLLLSAVAGWSSQGLPFIV